MSKWNAGAAILLRFGERDDRRAAIQDAVVVALDSSFPTPYRRMQTAPRWSLALVTLLAWFGGTMMGLALTPDGMALLQFKDALTTISTVLEGWRRTPPHALGAASIARPLCVADRSHLSAASA